MYKNRRLIVSVVAIVLALLMVGGLLSAAFAESSSEIKQKIEGLKQQEAAIQAQQAELQNQIPYITGLSGTLHLETFDRNKANPSYIFEKEE